MKLSQYHKDILSHAQSRDGRVSSFAFRRVSLNALCKLGLLEPERKGWFFLTPKGYETLNLMNDN